MGDTIKGIIFDMDGLMLDTEKLLTRFWCEAAAFYGFEMTKQHVLGIRSLSAKYAIPHLRGIFGESFDYRAVRAKRIELMNAFIEQNGIEKKKGLDILLESLSKRDIKLAVATATDIARTRMYLEKAGVIGYFDAIVTGDTVTNGKPEPDIYITAAQRLGLPCGECIALEDSPNGILSAYRAGCKPVMIPDLSAPDAETRAMLYGCFDSLDEFEGQLDVLL
jgi:HAD superfamily hydrolase (TIGR01509 family)